MPIGRTCAGLVTQRTAEYFVNLANAVERVGAPRGSQATSLCRQDETSHNLNVGFVPYAKKISALYFARSYHVPRRRDL